MNSHQSTMATDKLRPGGVAIVVICIVFIIPATLAVILRVWARRIKQVHLVWNDYLIIAALVRGFLQMICPKLMVFAVLCNRRNRDFVLRYVLYHKRWKYQTLICSMQLSQRAK